MVGVRPVEVRCDIHDVRIRLANWMIIEMPQNRRIGLAIREVYSEDGKLEAVFKYLVTK